MGKFIVNGGNSLNGEIKIQGSKNAAFPVIAAALLAEEKSVIQNVPQIADVHKLLEVLKKLGVRYKFDDHILEIDPSRMSYHDLVDDDVRRFRGSILLAGVMLAKFNKVKLCYPGGCTIGKRPIDVHLDGFRKLGAEVSEEEKFFTATASDLQGSRIVLAVTSVTGTENLILASIFAKGVTEIRLAATEPHVQDMCRFLNKMGAKIDGVGTPNLKITGVDKLSGAEHVLCADEIVAITYAIAAAATKGEVTISNIDTDYLDAPLAAMERMNVQFESGKDYLKILKPKGAYQATRIITGVFPQLLTDEQPLFGVLATQAEGVTRIHDWVYEGRQGYMRELEKMGARVEYDDVHRARIYGPSELHAAEIKTPDLRAGAAILIAALIAEGQSVIDNIEIVERGYERFVENLVSLGADIKRDE